METIKLNWKMKEKRLLIFFKKNKTDIREDVNNDTRRCDVCDNEIHRSSYAKNLSSKKTFRNYET